MNDVAAELQERNQDRFNSLELPDDDLLVEVEEQLLLPLPADLKEFLLTVSNVVYGAVEPATVTDEGLHTHLPDMATEAWERGLPRDLIAFCVNGAGYYVCDQYGVICVWDGDELDEEQQWQSIWDWTEEVWLNS